MTIVTFSASAASGYGGKQYIARVTGRDPELTFSREFIGRKYGRRGAESEATVDDPGLYMTCDIDRKGNEDETFYVVYEEPKWGLYYHYITKDSAMQLAKNLPTDWRIAVLEIRRAAMQELLASGRDPQGRLKLKTAIGKFAEGAEITRAELLAEIEAQLTPTTVADSPLSMFSDEQIRIEFIRRGLSV